MVLTYLNIFKAAPAAATAGNVDKWGDPLSVLFSLSLSPQTASIFHISFSFPLQPM